MKKCISLLTALSLILIGILSGCGDDTPSVPTVETTVAETTVAPTVALVEKDASLTPLLWKVTGDKGNTLYLFGTIHIGDERNDSVLANLADTIDECDAVAVECDVVAYQNDMEKMMQDLQSDLYLDGTTVRDYMPDDLYEECKAYLTEAGLYSSAYNYYDLSMWSQLMSAAAVTLSPYESKNAIDTKLINYAYANNMELLEVESIDFQNDMLDSFSDDLYLLEIREILENKDSYSDALTELYEAWLEGNEENINLILEEGDTEGYTEEELKMLENYTKTTLDDRNIGMTNKAIEYLNSDDSVFLAVGTAHMVGDKGIVKQLTDKGYKVEKIELQYNEKAEYFGENLFSA